MNFYHAYYKRQVYVENIEDWVDTDYCHQGIVVIADNTNEAIQKIYKCLAKAETDDRYRAVLLRITECIGLNIKQDFEGGSDIYPISEY